MPACVVLGRDLSGRWLLSSGISPAVCELGKPSSQAPDSALLPPRCRSWAWGPSTSLISDLLLCMMAFWGLGMEPSASALPSSVLQGPQTGARPGEPAS